MRRRNTWNCSGRLVVVWDLADFQMLNKSGDEESKKYLAELDGVS